MPDVCAGDLTITLGTATVVTWTQSGTHRRQWLPATEVIRELVRLGPDVTGMRQELRETLTQTTDDVSR